MSQWVDWTEDAVNRPPTGPPMTLGNVLMMRRAGRAYKIEHRYRTTSHLGV